MPGPRLTKEDKGWDPRFDSTWQLGREHGFKQGMIVGLCATLVVVALLLGVGVLLCVR